MGVVVFMFRISRIHQCLLNTSLLWEAMIIADCPTIATYLVRFYAYDFAEIKTHQLFHGFIVLTPTTHQLLLQAAARSRHSSQQFQPQVAPQQIFVGVGYPQVVWFSRQSICFPWQEQGLRYMQTFEWRLLTCRTGPKFQYAPFNDIEELVTRKESEKLILNIRKLTSLSAFLTISTSFVWPVSPGAKGIPRYSKTSLLGGGMSPQVINLMALTFVWAATWWRIVNEMAAIWGFRVSDVVEIRKGWCHGLHLG